jgi:hypothetical protein
MALPTLSDDLTVISFSFVDQDTMLQFARTATEVAFTDHVERTNNKNWKLMMPAGVSGLGKTAIAFTNYSMAKSLVCTQFAMITGVKLMYGTQMRTNNHMITDRDGVLRRVAVRLHTDQAWGAGHATERNCSVSKNIINHTVHAQYCAQCKSTMHCA